MSLQSTLLTTTPGSVYTSTGNTAAMTMYFTNYSSNNVAAFSLWAVKDGDTFENKNILYVNVTVQPGDTYLASTERLLLDNNDELYANATANTTMSTTLTYTSI
jgi:hypothetical protein